MRLGVRWGAALAVLAAALAAAPPLAPHGGPSATPAPPVSGGTLPLASTLVLVLDGPIDSRTSRSASVVSAHLRDPLVVGGRTIAGPGTTVNVRVVTVARAQAPDVDAAVQIHLDDLSIDGAVLPIRANPEYLRPPRSIGRSTSGTARDLAGDIFVPGYAILRNLRRGADFRLNAGATLDAITGATLDATDPGRLVVTTPPPFQLGHDAPHSDFTPIPLATYFVPPAPSPKPKPGATSSTVPSPVPSPSA